MDRNSLTAAMKTSIFNVLEKMFFLPLELNESRTSNYLAEINKVLCGKLMFKGCFSGQFLFYISECLANTITADFMGMDKKDISTSNVIETLKEIINMIAGNTFALYDDKAVFNLGIPAIFFRDSPSTDNPENVISLKIDTPDDQMILKMALNQRQN